MPIHDMIIDNANGAVARADINNAFAALVSNSSNATAPTTMYAYQWWADTTAMQMKIRNSTNTAWIVIGTLDAVGFGLPTTGVANTFLVGGQVIQDTDSGAAAIVALALDRNSASPAASDLLEALDWSGRNSTPVTKTYARLLTQLLDPTASSEDAQLEIWTMVAGTLARRAYVGQGIVCGAPTGGDKGVGTGNYTGLYINNVAVNAGALPVAATQAQLEAASDLTTFASPGRQQYHPSAAKALAKFTGATGTVLHSFNTSSITRSSQGTYVWNINIDFSSADWEFAIQMVGGPNNGFINVTAQAAGSLSFNIVTNGGSPSDPTAVVLIGFGDQI